MLFGCRSSWLFLFFDLRFFTPIQYAKQNNPRSKLKSWPIQQGDKTLLFWIRNKTRPYLLYTLYWKFGAFVPRNETARPSSQFLHSWISERFIYSRDVSYLESLFSCITWENSQLNRRSWEKGRELPLGTGLEQFSALPSPPAVELRVHKNDQHTNFHFWKITDHK